MCDSGVVKLAIVGGRRGRSFRDALSAMSDEVRLTAVCDLDAAVCAEWQQAYPEASVHSDYEEMLAHVDSTAVCISTPMWLHAEQALQALRAGKHVLSEVIAATTLEECWALVEAVEETGLTYMLAENYCYMRPNMMILNMAQQGLFGEINYAEGGYIHDCRHLMFNPDGSLTWRGIGRRDFNGNTYPTHSLGPVAQWLAINKPGGDRLATTATWKNRPGAVPQYAMEQFGADHPGAQFEYWACADTATTVIRTEKGSLINLRMDANSPRPHNMTHYALQGLKGAYLSARHHKEDPLVWIDGRSPGKSPGNAEWEPLWNYAAEYEHPRWQQEGETAVKAGHGGGDYFVMQDFVNAIFAGTPPPIDVYDAVTWSSICPLSIASVKQGGAPLDIPNFNPDRNSAP